MKPVFDQNTTSPCALKKVESWIPQEKNLVVGSVIFMTPAIFLWWSGNYVSDVGVVYLMMANDVSPRREEGTA